ncbi:MAG: hypothetical protein AAGA72_12885 [Pseudomonadota bacterium]
MHTETVEWLERQLRELDAWRRDLVRNGDGERRRLEQIDLHRSWLEEQIQMLSNRAVKSPA